MLKNQVGFIFYTLTKALMTLTTCGCVYLVRTLVRMLECPMSALHLYHSFPELAEHIVAGILFYVVLGFLFTKVVSSYEEPV